MANASRPLPSLDDPDSAPFWEATKQHQLRYPVCNACRQVIFFPRRHCPHCLSLDLRWDTSKGAGSVYTFSTVALSRHPFFGNKTPYVVALIDLDEGFRMMSNVVGLADPERELKVGQRVRVEWEDHEALSLPVFRPV